MFLESNFRQITTLFYNGNYKQGQKELTMLIQKYPNNPMLLANRAVFLSQLNEDTSAVQDIQASLQLQPMNYIPYFNLFSIHMKNNDDQKAVSNLYCSLSVMYLLRAKNTRLVRYCDKAIELAHNNVEARVLKGLLEIQDGRFEQGRKQFQKALKIQPGNYLLEELLATASNQLDPQCVYLVESCTTLPLHKRRLETTMPLPSSAILFDQTLLRIQEFNQLYNQLDGKLGGYTQRVPKANSFLNFNFNQSENKVKSRSESAINSLEEEAFQNIGKDERSQEMPTDSNDHVESHPELYGVKDQFEIEITEETFEKLYDSEPSIDDLPQKTLKFNLCPITPNCQIQIAVLNFSFLTPEQYPNLQHLYCIVTYNGSKSVTSPVPSVDGTATWNKTFPSLQSSQDPSILCIKMYNKQRNKILDQFMGQLQIYLTNLDLLKLPLLTRNKKQLGHILLDIRGQASIN